MQRFFSFLILLLVGSSLSAQVEVNVKLKANNNALNSYFEAKSDPQISLRPSATLLNDFPFVGKISETQSLRTAPGAIAPSLAGLFTLRLNSANEGAALAELQQSGAFEWVELNHTVSLHAIEADPPNDDSINIQWYHSYVKTFESWEITRGDNAVKIGVIDTGLDFEHPEFEGQVAINAGEDLNNNGTYEPWPSSESRDGVFGDFDGIDSDGNGYTDDVVGYDFTDQPRSPFGGDFINDDPHPADDNRHGTLVAGVIHAKDNNELGGAGLAPDTRLVVLRAFSASGQGEDDDIARAIIYATDNDVKILNLSFGDIYPSRMMHEAIKYAYSRGVIMIGSAGNGTGDELHYPSGFNEVISVSASTYDPSSDGREFLWPLSSYGVTVDLCAPGAGILTPTIIDTSSTGEITQYQRVQGTSFAAPMVASAAALLLSERPGLTPQQARGILVSSADDISSPGWDHFTGAGRLNILKALQTVGASLVQITSPVNDRGTAADSIFIIGTVLDPQFSSWSLEFQPGLEGDEEWISLLEGERRQTKEDTLYLWNLDTLPEGDYTLRLRVERTNGFPVEDRIRFVRETTPPNIEVTLSKPVWDNEKRKFLILYRDDDQGQHILNFRKKGSSDPYLQLAFDRITRNGEFLLDNLLLTNSEYEYFIEATNLAGMKGMTGVKTFKFEADFVNRSGFRLLDYTLPMGRFLEDTYDFNKNGFKDVVMNEYNEQLAFGKTMFYEFDGFEFQKRDSISFRDVTIPKDVADTDGDGLLELLCSALDSAYVLEQGASDLFPKERIYENLGNSYFAARWADIDDDDKLELLMKDFAHYYVFEGEGEDYILADSLKDFSGNYQGSIAPRLLVGDFDNDDVTETIFGDFDGDFLAFEPTFNGRYQPVFIDTTGLIKSGSYLCQGDFDGDGVDDFFVATHTSELRNTDFEYDTRYWRLRIFSYKRDNEFEVIWEDYLYDIDIDRFNGATAGNIDQDEADELIFSTYPRTYIIDFDSSTQTLGMKWFLYGALATHHLIEDFNGNGVNEFALGRGDTTFFWEIDFDYTGPGIITSLDGIVLGPDKILLNWPAAQGATSYELFQIHVDSARGPLFTNINATRTLATQDMIVNEPYRFFVRSSDGSQESPFGNQVIRIPHENNQLDSIEVINERQIALRFSWPVTDRPRDIPFFVLNGEHSPSAITKTGDVGNRLILSFEEPFETGMNALIIDSLFLDADFGIFDPNSPVFTFEYEPVEEDFLYLTNWSVMADQEAKLEFNYELGASALDPANYSVFPFGQVIGVSYADGNQQAVLVQVDQVTLGSLGYPVSIVVAPEVCAVNSTCIRADEGNTATFSSFQEDLSKVYVYPNPVRPTPLFEGLRFANLTQTATIRILNASGRIITEIKETDGDGGLTWNMQDFRGERIPPGVYLYFVTNSEGKEFMGKFSVIE